MVVSSVCGFWKQLGILKLCWQQSGKIGFVLSLGFMDVNKEIMYG